LLIAREKRLQLQLLRARLELLHVYETTDEHLGIPSQKSKKTKKNKRKLAVGSEAGNGLKKKAKKNPEENKSEAKEKEPAKEQVSSGKKRSKPDVESNENGKNQQVVEPTVEKKGPTPSNSSKTVSKKASVGKKVTKGAPSNSATVKKAKLAGCVERKSVHTKFPDDSDDSDNAVETSKSGGVQKGKMDCDLDDLDDSLDSEGDD